MKKNYLFIILICLLILPLKIKAENYYIPQRNTYYLRSQHSYAFLYDDIQYNAYIPALYTLLSNKDEAANIESWDFTKKYSVPWDINNSTYFIAYCADLVYNISEERPYRKVLLSDSTYIKNEIKDNLASIIREAYPFISEEQMKENLKSKNVLVEKKINNKTYLTAPNNEKPSRSVTIDELVSAIQNAILYFTNPGMVNKIYSDTHELTAKTVTRSAGIWNLTDKAGNYEEVKNNITAIYNYLIKLNNKEEQEEEKIMRIGVNDVKQMVVNLNTTENEDLNVEVYEKDNLVQKNSLKNLKQDYFQNYIVPLNKELNVDNAKIIVTGTVPKNSEIFIYEAVNGKEDSQTLIGANNYNKPVTLENKTKIVVAGNDSVSLTKKASKDYLTPNEEFNYILTVKNNESYPIDQILVTDEVPKELEIIETDGTINDNKINFNLALKGNEEKKITIKVKVKSNILDKKITNKANILINNIVIESNESTVTVFDNPDTNQKIVTVPIAVVIITLLFWLKVTFNKKKIYKL